MWESISNRYSIYEAEIHFAFVSSFLIFLFYFNQNDCISGLSGQCGVTSLFILNIRTGTVNVLRATKTKQKRQIQLLLHLLINEWL